MTEWHTIPAKFSSEEKKILDKLRDKYGLNYNQSLKGGVELLSRLIAIVEVYVTTNAKTMKKIRKIGNKYTKNLEAETREVMSTMPIKEQEEQSKQLADGITKIISQANDIFVKNRKRGRKSVKRKRGRPKDLGKTS
jgi:hypothetical protein